MSKKQRSAIETEQSQKKNSTQQRQKSDNKYAYFLYLFSKIEHGP
jgi:hypothetical protein